MTTPNSPIMAQMAAAAKKPNPRQAQLNELVAKVSAHYKAYNPHFVVKLKLHDDAFIVVMKRGQDGGTFTHLVTDQEPNIGPHGSLTRMCHGTFAIEIEEEANRMWQITLHVRAGCNLETLLEQALKADETRKELREVSKPAARSRIEMVIKVLPQA